MKKISTPMIIAGIGVLAGLGLIYFTIGSGETPRYSNDADRVLLAQCLSEKGVTKYGAYWCPYCANQRALFGKGWEHVTYVECAIQGQSRSIRTQACEDAGVEVYPTWELSDGTRFTGEQSLEKLARDAGCAYDTGVVETTTFENAEEGGVLEVGSDTEDVQDEVKDEASEEEEE